MGNAGAPNRDDDDRAAMQVTAAIRDVSEFQLFSDAYREWHGHDPTGNALETEFGLYLRLGVVPEFVRHYLRTYRERHPDEIATYQRELRRGQRIRRIAFWVIVIMVLLALTL